MSPTQLEHTRPYDQIPPQDDGNRIVISGMSGLYPQSRNLKEFSEILYNKVNPVTQEDIRFKYNHPEVVQYVGSIPELNYFDAQFFKVNYRLGYTMDPMSRKVMEQAYQAIYDAGVNPKQLSGKKVGVYIGSCFSEAEKACFYASASRSGFGVTGCNKSMFANRISYWLNAKGPSMSIDDACCSSTAALEQAYLALSRGECEAAIVGGTYLCLHPQSSLHYGRCIKLCHDGKTKSFDERADGCAKSEAINVLFLQKAKDAMRIYAEVLGAKTEFTCLLKEETGPKYGFYRDLNSITKFIEKFYQDARVPPQAIEYVEAFGCGLPEVDNIELQAIEEVFCKNRDFPLLIGSVMSNIGYGEAASGISAITKVLLGYHNGQLAANLHCEQPRRDIVALCDGRMRIVREHQQFDRTYVAVNGLSVTGVNSHVLLHGCYKPKNLNRYTTNLPYLVTVSGRHEEAVKYILEILKSNPIDPEQLALLHNIHRMSISGHMSRGFIILRTDAEQIVSLHEKADYFDDERRPLWFVYSGMGSQWAGMGKQLMRIPIFAAAIERCGQALEPKGIDIVNIITSDDESIFDNILNSFVGIAAIQIGLTDVLHELGFKPDGIIGHSVGELGCAYADGCLTTEEMILSAYYRGLVSLETEFIQGSMAAVGMGYEQVSDICPPEITVACHNGPQSSTLSGPSDVMREFVAELTNKGVFAKEVPCSNIAYHSPYIADAGPGLLKYLKDTIRTPKARSERWLSTSVPQERWNEPIAKLCSAEYLTNNLLNSVLFEETSRLVPNDAVLVEIAPHGLLQAILKRSMPSNCKNIPLTRRNHPDNTVLLLEAIGKLHMQGYNSNLQVLYPKVEMPVSTGTPFLSHFVKWAHGEKWPMPLYRSASRKVAANCYLTLALHDKEHSYLGGNSIRGNTVYPFAASLMLVWDLLAMLMNIPKKQLSVEFSNLQLYSQPILHDRRQLQLSVTIQRGTGYFEVLDDNSKVARGYIFPELRQEVKYIMDEQNKNMHFNTNEIYQLLRGRDYSYSDEFQIIARVDESFKYAELVWRDNWVTFIDGMLQLNVLRESYHAVSQPTRIRRIVIDVKAHSNAILDSRKSDRKTLIRARVSEKYDNTRCGGVIIENIMFEQLPPYSEPEMLLKSLTFVPYYSSKLEICSSLEVYSQIVAENSNKITLTVVGIQNQPEEGSLFKEINDIINNIFRIKINYKQITRKTAMENYKFENVDLIVLANLSTDKEICQHFEEILPRDKFIVSEEYESLTGSSRHSSMYRVLSVHTNDQTKLHLVRWGTIRALTATTTVSVYKETDLDFLSSVHANLTTGHRLLVLTCYPIPSGLKELISSWQNETIRNKVHLVTIKDCYSYNSDLDEKFLEMNLAFSTVTNGNWGGEYYLSMNKRPMGSRNMALQGAQFGDYESLKWANIPALTGSGVTVNVHYAGINNNDLKQADGSLLFKKNVNNNYGMDFSGITESGKPVMGIVRNGAASTQVKALPELLWPVPAHWSLEDAATVPLAYVQAFYCLRIKIELKQGMSVFVHGAAGALGQAIISIALAHSCEIFATVSDIRKKHFLLKMFPELKADHIGCSRDHTFTDMVETVSKGEKCDVVISCVKGKLKDITFNCLTFRGQFLDISQLENSEEYTLGMAHFNMYKQYISVDFSSIFEPENVKDLETIHKMVSEGIARGCVRPLSRLTYGPHEVARAFRLLARSSHRGRVLIHLKGKTIYAQNRIKCSANRSQLILCGKTSYGLQFADRLVTRGAKQLHLHVPTQSSYLQQKIRCWQKLDINIVVSSEPLDSQESVVSLITSSVQLGPLEGVYIIAEETNTDHNLISNLDAEIRKICSDLSYFSVIYFGDNSIGKNVCLNRLNDQLPTTVLLLPEIKEELYNSFVNWRGAVDAAEQALQNTHGVILAHENKHRLSLLQQIANLAGLSIPDDVTRSVTLAELGIQHHKLQPLCNFLRVQYNLAFDEEQVRSLTIDTILETERKVIALPCEDIRGLSTYFRYIDSDELLATTEIVFLPTHVSSVSMRDDEFDANQTNLCIIPGMEGHHERFRVFCERLKLPALVLQPGLDHPHETVVETAQRFAEVLLKKTGMKDTFYLLGYESGIVVALEIAAILEDLGLTGKVFCVGCAPEEFVNELEEQLSAFEDEEQLQDGVLRHMYALMTGGDCTALEHALQNSTTWSEKLDVCIRTLLGRVSHSAQYARSLIECALIRLNQKQHYSATSRPLRSQVILLRAALGHALPQHTTLQDISEQPLVVHQLTSPMAHIMTDLRCAAIINDHLDPAILESFASRNICDTYLLNADSYMSLE